MLVFRDKLYVTESEYVSTYAEDAADKKSTPLGGHS